MATFSIKQQRLPAAPAVAIPISSPDDPPLSVKILTNRLEESLQPPMKTFKDESQVKHPVYTTHIYKHC